MTSALIGHSGFVGTTLQKQRSFDDLFRSTNIADIEGQSYDEIVCAGAPAQKWLANQDPEADAATLDGLMAHLFKVKCKRFILISTVDVFKSPVEVDEQTTIDLEDLHAYGLNRYRLEEFVRTQFKDVLIVRLPGLVGPGLRKNIIYDFLNDNQVDKVDSQAVFQFYPMINLWYDIQTALDAGLDCIHLTAEPVSVADVASKGFGMTFDNPLSDSPARYDMRTRFAQAFGGAGQYTYSARESLQAIRAYAQSEAKTAK